MDKKAPYRNAIRSKKMIKLAFLELITQKDISKIRIREITEIADISKGTFYAHYQDIYAILEEIEDDNIARMITFLNEQPRENLLNDFSPIIIKIFNQIESNKEFYSMLFKSNSASSFLYKLQQVFVDYMMNDSDMLEKLKSREEAKMFFSFVSVGTANLIHEWFLSESTVEFTDLAKILNNYLMNGVSAIKKH